MDRGDRLLRSSDFAMDCLTNFDPISVRSRTDLFRKTCRLLPPTEPLNSSSESCLSLQFCRDSCGVDRLNPLWEHLAPDSGDQSLKMAILPGEKPIAMFGFPSLKGSGAAIALRIDRLNSSFPITELAMTGTTTWDRLKSFYNLLH
jgi:hypothetical protein